MYYLYDNKIIDLFCLLGTYMEQSKFLYFRFSGFSFVVANLKELRPLWRLLPLHVHLNMEPINIQLVIKQSPDN